MADHPPSPRDGRASYEPEPAQSSTMRGSQPPHVSSSQHRPGSASAIYDAPDSYQNLEELHAERPVQDVGEGSTRRRHSSREDRFPARTSAAGDHDAIPRRRSSVQRHSTYEVPDDWVNLDELAATSPVENFRESAVYRHQSLEETRTREQDWQRDDRMRRRDSLANGDVGQQQQHRQQAVTPPVEEKKGADTGREVTVSKLATEIYTLSYLIFFSLLGALARIGLTALTTYPGTPVIFPTVWSNFGGSLIMGFLSEDRMLFRDEWGTPAYENAITQNNKSREGDGNGDGDEENGGSSSGPPQVDIAAAKKAHLAAKKTIPLYIGLATGFCGSFTSFSSFIKDTFLALSNDMTTPGASNLPTSRNGGYSFMAMLAVILTTVGLSLSALIFGAHLAIAVERFTPSLSYPITRRFFDPLAVFLGWGCWLGAVLLSIFPPHDDWRGRATFSLVFAPLGTLIRFYLAIYLNGKIASFPLGTFTANISGTMILGMAWDIAHSQIGGVVGCQVLQGVEDGFCGCLTTISTWVAELNSLRRWHAYVYGLTSVVVGLACMIAVMGGLRWTEGFKALQCSV